MKAHSLFSRWRAALTQRTLGTAAAAGLIAGASASAGWYGTMLVADDTAAAAPAAAPRMIGAGVDSYAELVSHVAPAVVTIRSEGRRQNVHAQAPDDDFLRRFFGEQLPRLPQPPEGRMQGLGSGVIVRADGHVLTNHHVIDGAEKVTVELQDRRTFAAVLVGSDAPSDLALLKIDAGQLQALTLADSNAVSVGDVVLALGNPLGVGQTVTMGIISAKGRATGLGDGSFEDFLQTDAPINTGNSGGALVNTRGELVGINSQILSPTGGNIGIGFAIPSSMARSVMEQLMNGGRVRRSQLGVTAQSVDSAIASSLGLKSVGGALIADVSPGSAAERAGLTRGDVILAVDNHLVADSNALRNRIASTAPGTAVTMRVFRHGKEQDVKATLDELKTAARDSDSSAAPADRGTFGLTVEALTAERARELGVRAQAGVVVTSVARDSAAADAALRAGDVIAQVDGQSITTSGGLRDALNSRSGRPALVLVHRGNQSVFVTLQR